MPKQLEADVARRNERPKALSHEESRERRRVIAAYVAKKINRGTDKLAAQQQAAAYFGVSDELVRVACRQHMATKAIVKPKQQAKSRRK